MIFPRCFESFQTVEVNRFSKYRGMRDLADPLMSWLDATHLRRWSAHQECLHLDLQLNHPPADFFCEMWSDFFTKKNGSYQLMNFRKTFDAFKNTLKTQRLIRKVDSRYHMWLMRFLRNSEWSFMKRQVPPRKTDAKWDPNVEQPNLITIFDIKPQNPHAITQSSWTTSLWWPKTCDFFAVFPGGKLKRVSLRCTLGFLCMSLKLYAYQIET